MVISFCNNHTRKNVRLIEFMEHFDKSTRVQILCGKNLLFSGSVCDFNTLLNSEVVAGGSSCGERCASIQIADSHEVKNAMEIKRYILLVTGEGWNHDGDEWLGIYVNDEEVKEAYNRAMEWFGKECENGNYCESQKLMIYRFNIADAAFERVNPEELE